MSALRIVLTGGECTGKTTLARALAERYDTVWVPEAAREAAVAKAGPLGPEDVAPIARAHVAAADKALREATRRARPAVFFDQDLLSTVIYARHYYGHCPPWIQRLAAERLGDLYLLCLPDLPWTPDPARDRGDRREEIHALFAAALADVGARVAHVSGAGAERAACAAEAVEALLATLA
ncbi:MAG: AAA family ATPase [Thermoanaerobaculia bacterium]